MKKVFAALDRLESLLDATKSKYLFGEHITDMDVGCVFAS